MSNISNSSESNSNNAHVIAIIAYFAFIGWIIAIILNSPKDEFASFHIRQALGIHLIFIASSFVMIIPVLGWIAGMAGFLIAAVLWLLGILTAVQRDMKPVNLWGKKFQEWFKGL